MGISKVEQNQRIVYVDFLKVISIYLVCLYHFNHFRVDILSIDGIGVYRNYFFKGIASTAVPIFIMVNGHLMLNSKKEFSYKNHIQKIIRLIILTTIWSVILLVFASIIKGNEYTFKSFIYSISILESGTLNQLWYMYALISIYIIYPIIKEMYDKENKILLYYFLGMTFILTFGNVFINILCNVYEYLNGSNVFVDNGYNFFRNINIYRGTPGYTFVYFIVGALLGKYIRNNGENIKLYIPIITLILGQLLLFGYGIIMTKSNNTTFDVVFDGYDTIMTLIMSVSIFIVAFKIDYILQKLSRILNIIGDNTLGIYLIHPIIGWSLIEWYRNIPKSTNIFMNLLFGLLVMLISLGISLVIKKIPFIKKLLKM